MKGELVLAESTEHTELSPGNSAPSGSCFSGKHPRWQCADSCLRASACCSCLWLCAKKFGGTCLRGVSMHVLLKASLLLLKSKVLRSREVNSLLVFQAEKDEMCL